MLKLINITKDYAVADTTVRALKGVSLSFRKNEFVSVLGPSGCGKTTLLNIIGGLDKYTSGDLFVNGRSTKGFKDRDWDVYRNRRVGFVFQSYNLIPHQTVLGNVELALTIAGMSKAERVERAKKALDKVGLTDQYYKRPNQLSGGQCQRVAIARALVNDPEILLADEPTGALDTTTSKQIMDIVKEIAKERLVVMVTHNAELAKEYSTRIIRLLDGSLVSDSRPFGEEEERTTGEAFMATKAAAEKAAKTTGGKKKIPKREKAQMSFWTAFKLSLQNLLTKKRRTAMTSIAGSIGIIGVSMVLSISSGIQGYIDNMQNDMLSGNPIEIMETAFDISGLLSNMNNTEQVQFVKENGLVNVASMIEQIVARANRMENLFVQNNIDQHYIDYINNMPVEYLAALLLDYELDVSNNIYTDFSVYQDGARQNISLSGIRAIYSAILTKVEGFEDYATMIGSVVQSFEQAPDAEDYLLSQYDLVYGRVAQEKNEVMIVLGSDRTLADLLLAQLGYYSQEEFINLANKAVGNAYDQAMYRDQIEYDELIAKVFTWYPNDSVFTKTGLSNSPFTYDPYYIGSDGLEFTIVGILEPKDSLSYGMLSNGFYYTTAFAEYVIEQNRDSELAQELYRTEKTSFTSAATFFPEDYQFPGSPAQMIYSGITFDYTFTYEGVTEGARGLVGNTDQLSALMSLFVSGGSNDNELRVVANATFSLQQLGGSDLPTRIAVYPLDFDQKEHVLAYLDEWNGDGDIIVNGTLLTSEERENITYTDALSLIIGMMQSLVRIITIALVGFTSLSLVVSCVMIAIITYVSVVERIKEIGVIRSLGGRKRDVSNLFIAETFILGLSSGLIGILVTYLLSAVINWVVGFADVASIAVFPWHYAVIMVCVSVGLMLISGVVPSRSAAKKDPVVALRTE
ncbi:MAG: ABC transporter ATP-binding protein/permease [Dehalococcoidia bacterium]|nr:ABC transporter ATP-binding protein/permease [Dehalococcoidia bacterium]